MLHIFTPHYDSLPHTFPLKKYLYVHKMCSALMEEKIKQEEKAKKEEAERQAEIQRQERLAAQAAAEAKAAEEARFHIHSDFVTSTCHLSDYLF